MGDRFYEQQKTHKPVNRLKADIISEIQMSTGIIPSLDKMTKEGLLKLEEYLKNV